MRASEGTTYGAFEASSVKNRRLLRQEELILKAATALSEMLEREGVSKVELVNRLGRTKGFVTQILAGDKNLTLRTIADVAGALGTVWISARWLCRDGRSASTCAEATTSSRPRQPLTTGRSSHASGKAYPSSTGTR